MAGILTAFVIAATTVCFVVKPVKDTVSSNAIDGWNNAYELIKGN